MRELSCRLFFKKEMELTLIGLNNAGKSTLVEVLASGNFKQDMFATVRCHAVGTSQTVSTRLQCADAPGMAGCTSTLRTNAPLCTCRH